MAWWLYLDGTRDASYNMAKDEYLLHRSVEQGIPSVRLYGWHRPTLSIGYAQKVERQVDLSAAAAEGVDLVRRITGGRAVLHGADLTYAVAAPTAGTPFTGGIMGIYQSLAQVFVHLLQGFGLAPEVKAYQGRERAEQASPICFSTPSAFELLLAGRKVVGSAQRLLAQGFLQHGSIPLTPQHELLARLFHGATPASLAGRMTDLRTEGVLDAYGETGVREALVRAFAATYGIALEPGPWSEADEASVQALAAERYPLLQADALARAG